MQYKFFIALTASFILSLSLNYFSHHNLFISLINSFTYALSIYLFKNTFITKNILFNFFLIISLGLIPLFKYSPNGSPLSLLPLLSVGIISLYKYFPKKWVIVLWILFLFFGNFYSNGIIKYPFIIQSSQLIFNSPEVNYNMYRHQQDALFIPYKARLLVYSQLIYIYAFLTNLFDFLNLKNLFNVLLIANIYPFFTGIFTLVKQKLRYRGICLTAFLITALTTGIDRSAESFKSLYLLGPIFIYLTLLGAQTINKKIYIVLWFISLFLITSQI